MKRIAIVYYSATGNTEAMADIIKTTLQGKADVDTFTCDNFSPEMVKDYEAIAFGCPAMGDEVLEEDSFEPMFTSVEPMLEKKTTALFGSYGWGDGEWMRNWKERAENDGAVLVSSVICQDAPDEVAKAELEALANALL